MVQLVQLPYFLGEEPEAPEAWTTCFKSVVPREQTQGLSPCNLVLPLLCHEAIRYEMFSTRNRGFVGGAWALLTARLRSAFSTSELFN